MYLGSVAHMTIVYGMGRLKLPFPATWMVLTLLFPVYMTLSPLLFLYGRFYIPRFELDAEAADEDERDAAELIDGIRPVLAPDPDDEDAEEPTAAETAQETNADT